MCIAETTRKRKRGRPSLGPREAFLIKVRPEATQAVRELAEIRGVTAQLICAAAIDQWLTRQVAGVEDPVSGEVLARRAHADRTLAQVRRDVARRPHS